MCGCVSAYFIPLHLRQDFCWRSISEGCLSLDVTLPSWTMWCWWCACTSCTSALKKCHKQELERPISSGTTLGAILLGDGFQVAPFIVPPLRPWRTLNGSVSTARERWDSSGQCVSVSFQAEYMEDFSPLLIKRSARQCPIVLWYICLWWVK